MKFFADLHIHSKYSRATAKNLDLEHICQSAQIKGISIVGTGDFTHPGWFEEIQQKLMPTPDGFYKLAPDIKALCDEKIPAACRADVLFMPVTEISNIYKKNGKTRKNHNLVILPDLEAVRKFNNKLEKIGNIQSDGRPILGLDAKYLLEIVLETSEKGGLIPAHIWTPWFSVLGSKSGFNAITECFEDLTPYIFAVETGLSSDPAMNWRVSNLDDFTLISNSDAHSPGNIGREANLFDTERTYESLIAALKKNKSKGFSGTVEFFPEEGKYHLDGHRNCKQRLWPEDTRRQEGICSHCGKPLTLGVLYRVEELADRSPVAQPTNAPPFHYAIPLADMIAETLGVGPKTKKVQQLYLKTIEMLGPEFEILHSLGIEDIKQTGIPLLHEAIRRMRRGELDISPGYDGEYGKINIFKPGERKTITGQAALFHTPVKRPEKIEKPSVSLPVNESKPGNIPSQAKRKIPAAQKPHAAAVLNREQQEAVEFEKGPLMIVAGPGTGKTHTLTHRIFHLISVKAVPPEQILAITFTQKASQEMRERLQKLLPEETPLPLVTTFHGLGHQIMSRQYGVAQNKILSMEDQQYFVNAAVKLAKKQGVLVSESQKLIAQGIVSAKQRLCEPDKHMEDSDPKAIPGNLTAIFKIYQGLLKSQGACDFEDLVFGLLKMLESSPDIRATYQQKYQYVFVDEYQDVNHAQHRIIQLLAAPQNNICVIGDPDQSIYGFRGSSARFFHQFVNDYPETVRINLIRNYRSTDTILKASYQVVDSNRQSSAPAGRYMERPRVYSDKSGEKTIAVLTAPTERSEAVAVGKTIENLIGGSGYHYMDFSGNEAPDQENRRSFSDFAVLFRTARQNRIFTEVFTRAGIPFQVVSRKTIFLKKGVDELISLLKITEGLGSLADLDRIKSRFVPRITPKNMQQLTGWALSNCLSLNDLLAEARRFPVTGLDAKGQTAVIAFFNQIHELRSKVAGLPVQEKLKSLAMMTGRINSGTDDTSERTHVDQLFSWAADFTGSTTDLIRQIALQTDTDSFIPQAEKVALMTMHAAKGLEFPVVFIAGCENGYLPMAPTTEEPVDVSEERRLFYVAMTRARDILILSWARKRKIHGRLQQRSASPFIADIENELKNEKQTGLQQKARNNHKQLALF